MNEMNANNPIGGGEGIVRENVTNVSNFYYNIVSFLLMGLGVAAVLVLVYAGIMYVTAGNDEEQATRAKKTIWGAIIGLIVIIGAYAIYNYTLGIFSPS